MKNCLSHKIILSKPGPIIDFAMSSNFKLVVLISMLMPNVVDNGDVVFNTDANAGVDNDNDIAVHSFNFNLVSAYLPGFVPPSTMFIN